MKSGQLLLVVLAFAGFVVFCNAQEEQCDANAVTPVYNFTTERMLGTWNIWKFIAKLPEDVYTLDFRCLEFDLLPAEGSETFELLIHERYINTTSGDNANTTAYVMISDTSDAAWKVFGFRGDVVREHNIVHVLTDYDNWAIQYGCSILNNSRYEDMTILTRSRTPSEEAISVLEAILRNFGYDPVANGMPVDHSNC